MSPSTHRFVWMAKAMRRRKIAGDFRSSTALPISLSHQFESAPRLDTKRKTRLLDKIGANKSEDNLGHGDK